MSDNFPSASQFLFVSFTLHVVYYMLILGQTATNGAVSEFPLVCFVQEDSFEIRFLSSKTHCSIENHKGHSIFDVK